MVAGLIVTHGNLAEELIRTARSVVGDFDKCYAFSNKGKSTQALSEEMGAALAAADTPCVIFVDFMGGSCSHACLRVAAGRPDIVLLGGINLPMLLAFINKRDEIPFEKLADAILERSHASVRIIDPENL
jgi:mannose/fructose-specific phosphotransferase system component IIA